MEDMQPHYDDEIDLVDLFKTIWDGKWQIIGAVVVAAVAAVGVLRSLPNEFTATTEIRPVATTEADRYSESNALGFFRVDRERLQNTFIEELRDGDVLVQAVKRFGLIDRATFDSDAEYQEAVLQYADSIELLPPANQDGSERGSVRENWSLVGKYHDGVVWREVLRFSRDTAVTRARAGLAKRFDLAMSVAERNKMFEIEDLKTQMSNARLDFDKRMEEFEMRQQFELEDVKTQIENIVEDYERKITDRLAFLEEQAEIARKLGVSKNTIEAQTFATQAGFVANVQTDVPFYLRGYEAIEKEIELIKLREDKRAFMTGLFELETQQRQMIQDKTLQRAEQEKAFLEGSVVVERQIRALEQDLTLERARLLFDQTPVVTGEGFVAVSMVIEGTDFHVKRSKLMILVLVVLLTGMLAVIYVLISSAMRKRANQESVV